MRGLRWLRACMLAMIIACAALALLVTYQGHRKLSAASGPGARAIVAVNQARSALAQAGNDATANFTSGDESLLGTSTEFTDDLAAADQALAQAAAANIAGVPGANEIQFSEGLLASYSGQVAQAALDDAAGGSQEGRADIGATQGGTGIVSQAQGKLDSLRRAERRAAEADLRSRWLGSRDVWSLLVAPFLAMLVLSVCTTRLLWNGFRRVLSVRLVLALVLTLALLVLAALLTALDAGQTSRASFAVLYGNPMVRVHEQPGVAYSLWSLTAGLILALAAGALAYDSYRPRLEEYRYRP